MVLFYQPAFAQNLPKYGTWGYNGQLKKSQFIVLVCLHDLYIISENHRCQWSVRLSRGSIVNRALDPGSWVPAPDYPGPASAILVFSSPLYLWVVGWSARCRGGSVARFISENVLFVFFQYIRQSLWQKTTRTIYPDDMISPSHVVGWHTLVGSGITQGEISDPDEKDKSLRCWSAAAVSTLKQKLSCSHP